MPRTKSQALTTAWVKQSTEPGAYSDGYGLTLRIDGKGSKRWIQRLTIEGRQRNAGLGSWPGVSLDEAREKALVNWRVAREGRDPIAERRMAKANARMPRMPTFEEVARRVIALRRPTWSSEKHAGQWESTLATYVFPAIGRQLVNAVTTADVIAILEPIWTTKAETATRVRQRMEVVFDYAIASGWRVDNPAIAVTKALPRRRGKKEHHPAMTYGRMPAFIQTLRASTADSSTKLGLEFLILTAARTGEVRFMEWREVDTGAATWTVPASRMKARREHRVPLSRPALAVLEEVRNVGTGRGLVFPSRKGKGTGVPVPEGEGAEQHGLQHAAAAAGHRGCGAARLPVDLQGLDTGRDEPSVGRGGSGVGPHPGVRHRGSLRPVRLVRQAPGADGSLGEALRA